MLQTSFKTRSSKNSLLSINVVQRDEFGDGNSGDCEDGMVKKSPRSKNLNGTTDYLTLNAR